MKEEVFKQDIQEANEMYELGYFNEVEDADSKEEDMSWLYDNE